MLRRLPVLLALGAAALAACTEPVPEVSLVEQVPAAQREAMEAEEEEAAGDGGEGEAAEVTGEFVAVDIDFAEAPEELPAGENVLALVNEGNAVHNVVFEELGDELVAEANGGETDVGTIALEPGTYTYYCSIPGHRAAGMEGEVTVA